MILRAYLSKEMHKSIRTQVNSLKIRSKKENIEGEKGEKVKRKEREKERKVKRKEK